MMKSTQSVRVIAAGTIGNVLEWYDFAIYGYFATAIGRGGSHLRDGFVLPRDLSRTVRRGELRHGRGLCVTGAREP
jgi:hypothetical protein